jgi:NADH:ubiquinone oxidoreductase subunit 5 (subunit L)/multisubunit Na+/H+ antiporter MnhA subunit
MSIKLIPTILTFSGFFLSYIIYNYKFTDSRLSPLMIKSYTFLNNRWFFDYIYNRYIGYPVINIGYEYCYKLIDKGFLEFFGPTGLSTIIYKIINYTIKFQTGIIYHYISMLFITFLYIFIYFDFYYF